MGGQPFPGAQVAGQMQMAGMVRAPPQFPIPPGPPGQGMYPGGPAQMAAMRGMHQHAAAAGAFGAYHMQGGAQQPGAPGQGGGGGGPPRFLQNPAGFSGPQPPRSSGPFQPRLG
jgi:hypothetical protein